MKEETVGNTGLSSKFVEKKLLAKIVENNVENSQIVTLMKYKEMLIDWNLKINLTSLTKPEDIFLKHFRDSLECKKFIKPNDNVIDIGTGAGFPGIVLSIFMKDVKFTLVDSLNKRVNFLNEVIKELNLKNVCAYHSRIEDFLSVKENNREKYDVAVSRAVAQTNILLEFMAAAVKPSKTILLMKSKGVDEELKNAQKCMKTLDLEIIKRHEYILKYDDSNSEEFIRNIIVLKKNSKTKDIYPRSYGKIKKNPL